MIEWKDEYELGIPLIDEQHKKLFDIAGDAQELLLMPKSMDKFDEIATIIDELRAYVEFHFEAEQGIMEKIRFPKYFSHKFEHQALIKKMNELDIHNIDDDQQNQLLNIVTLIIDWITEHVLEKDKVMAAHYKKVKGEV
jgi:hemerythrin